MRAAICIALTLVTGALAGAAAAQSRLPSQSPAESPTRSRPTPTADQTSAEVVVTARADTKEEVRAFVEALLPRPIGGQYSRFERQEVCPAVIGLPPAYASAVVARMRRVAASARVPVAKPKCVANVLIMVTKNKPAFIGVLRDRYPIYLSGLSRSEVRRLAADTSPAVAWQQAGPGLNADGVELVIDPDTGAQQNPTTVSGSRITASGRPQYAGAVVVIDSAALPGLSTTQLADYAAMRAFAPTDPARLADSSAPTILKILEAPADAEVPVTLTPWDLGFLRALYAAPLNLGAAAERSAISGGLNDRLDRPARR